MIVIVVVTIFFISLSFLVDGEVYAGRHADKIYFGITLMNTDYYYYYLGMFIEKLEWGRVF
jgi:hypothetical protein